MNTTVDAGTSAIREEVTWHPMTGRSGNDTSIYGNSRLYSTRWKVAVPRSALNTQASASPIVHDDVHFEVKWLLGRPLVVVVELSNCCSLYLSWPCTSDKLSKHMQMNCSLMAVDEQV